MTLWSSVLHSQVAGKHLGQYLAPDLWSDGAEDRSISAWYLENTPALPHPPLGRNSDFVCLFVCFGEVSSWVYR